MTDFDALAGNLGLEPGRVTWLVGRPGTGLSSVAAAAVRRATAAGESVFVSDPEGAFRDGDFTLYAGSSLDETLRFANGAAEDGADLLVLDALTLVLPAGTWAERERELYYASGSLRGMAYGPTGSRASVLATVHEPREGLEMPEGGRTKVARAFVFPIGEGFDGDRVVRLTPEGTLEVLRP